VLPRFVDTAAAERPACIENCAKRIVGTSSVFVALATVKCSHSDVFLPYTALGSTGSPERLWFPPHAFDAFSAALYYSKLILIVQSDHHLQITLDLKKPATPPQTELTRLELGLSRCLKIVSRGVIYLVNSVSLRVPRVEPATDIQLEKEYEHYVV
jgi:hypothetical protein